MTSYIDVENLIGRPIPTGWEEMFCNAYNNLVHIWNLRKNRFILGGPKQCPKEEDLFRIFDLVHPECIKVVIFGQDPYHTLDKTTGEPIADGLSFSSRFGIQPSLRKVISEIKRLWPEHEDEIKKCKGNLEHWARQGVFLINKCLTVETGKPKSHERLWDLFIYHVIVEINKLVESKQVIVVLRWGKDAKSLPFQLSSFIKCIDTGHPSPLNRNPKTAFNGDCLKEANDYLISKKEQPIRWWQF